MMRTTETSTEGRSPRSVLLLTVDSLRWDADNRFDLAKSSDEEIVSFDRAFATGPGTSPSFPGLLTGTLPLSYGGLGPLSDERPRLSSELWDAGFNTAGFQCNPFLSRHFNYDQGFTTFEDYQHPLMGVATKIFPRGIEINNPKLRQIDDLLHITDIIKKSYRLVKGKPRPYVSAEVITNDTIEWLKDVDESFFCWVHYMDVHHPCFPPEKYRDRYDVASVTQSDVSEWYSALLREPETLTQHDIEALQSLYDAAIDYTDQQIGRLIDYLKETGRYEDTLIVFTSDHGELFGEHGQYGKPERMFDELLRVPLIVVNGPEYLSHATDHLVSLLDVPPLIHDALGLDVIDEFAGRIPGKDHRREYIIAEHEVEGNVIVGARSENWLYEADEIVDEHRLFSLQNRSLERVDLSHPVASDVRSAVLERLDELEVDARYLQDNMEDDVESRLEDLGYL